VKDWAQTPLLYCEVTVADFNAEFPKIEGARRCVWISFISFVEVSELPPDAQIQSV